MPTYKVTWDYSPKTVMLLTTDQNTPAGYVDIGTFEHHAESVDELQAGHSHVIYHHVRDMLYKLTPSVQDMHMVTIIIGGIAMPLNSLAIAGLGVLGIQGLGTLGIGL